MENLSTDDHFSDIHQLLLGIPVNIQTGDLSSIERSLSWTVWGWLVEQYIDDIYDGGYEYVD